MTELDSILEGAREKPIDRNQALFLFYNTEQEENAEKLFAAARVVRRRETGDIFRWSGGIASVLPCTLKPLCSYCPYWREPGKKCLPVGEIVKAAQHFRTLGIDNFHLSGGTTLGSEGLDILEIIQAIWDAGVRDMKIMVNCGAAMSFETLVKVGAMGVASVGSTFETTNPEVFKKVKPGDDLEAKKQFARRIGEAGLGLASGIMAGLGSRETRYEDYVNSIFDLAVYPHLVSVYVSKFNPVDTTPMKNHPQCPAQEGARLIAVMRLALRGIDIDPAAGWSNLEHPLAYRAGAGTKLFSVGANRRADYWKPEGDVEQRFVEETIVYNDSRAEKRKLAARCGFTIQE